MSRKKKQPTELRETQPIEVTEIPTDLLHGLVELMQQGLKRLGRKGKARLYPSVEGLILSDQTVELVLTNNTFERILADAEVPYRFWRSNESVWAETRENKLVLNGIAHRYFTAHVLPLLPLGPVPDFQEHVITDLWFNDNSVSFRVKVMNTKIIKPKQNETTSS